MLDPVIVAGPWLLVGTKELGLAALYDAVHHVEEAAHDAVGGLGAVAGWLVNTFASALIGLAVGAVAVAVMTLLFHRRGARAESGAKSH